MFWNRNHQAPWVLFGLFGHLQHLKHTTLICRTDQVSEWRSKRSKVIIKTLLARKAVKVKQGTHQPDPSPKHFIRLLRTAKNKIKSWTHLSLWWFVDSGQILVQEWPSVNVARTERWFARFSVFLSVCFGIATLCHSWSVHDIYITWCYTTSQCLGNLLVPKVPSG